jgi:hypothetical protein
MGMMSQEKFTIRAFSNGRRAKLHEMEYLQADILFWQDRQKASALEDVLTISMKRIGNGSHESNPRTAMGEYRGNARVPGPVEIKTPLRRALLHFFQLVLLRVTLPRRLAQFMDQSTLVGEG